MSTVSISAASRVARENALLEEVLLRELARVAPEFFPGVDGMTASDMLRDYSRWAQRGVVPGPQRLVSEHPELAAEVDAYFTC